ncbi:MAG: TonB-dependent receptor [Moheibacter sp.]
MNFYTRVALPVLFLIGGMLWAQQLSLSGKITDKSNHPIPNAVVIVDGTDLVAYTDLDGKYNISPIENGQYLVTIELPNDRKITESVVIDNHDVKFNYKYLGEFVLDNVEIFGRREEKPKGIEQITRFPVNTNQQIQTVSIISEKLIENQGVLTLTDAARNVPGVIQFASYGGPRESMSIRGYRGTPTLKNGVRMDSDFRTGSAITDMAGVESIQIIKGSAAITQGVGDDLGSAGGVINIVTKTPNYKSAAELSVRSGSWWRSRMQYDAQTAVLDSRNLGFRITGAFETGKSYRDEVKNKKVYVNPSLGWKIDDKTELIMEMDYLNQNSTPDRGTVNLASDTDYALYKMNHKFMGFKDDNVNVKNLTYSARIHRNITDKIVARVGYFNSYFEMDSRGATISSFKDQDGDIIYNKRVRGIGRSFTNDRNSTLQIDLMGSDMNFGIFKWAWQAGYDYTMSRVDSRSAKGIKKLDVIDVLDEIPNPNSVTFGDYDAEMLELGESTLTRNYYYGFMTQHHLSITDYVKIIGGVRWSYSINQSKSVVDPMIGLMFSPVKNVNFFGSYTTTSSLRSAANPMEEGGTLGVSRTYQYEFGFKSQWFNDRFRINMTYFDMDNKNMSYQIYDENQTPTGLYGKAGNLKRNGVELELAGRPIKSLHVMLGYSYLDAKYHNSPAFMDSSRPMNSPYSTANAWAYYKFDRSLLKGFSIGAGVYYVGDRPANDYTKITSVHDTTPGIRYFNMPAYTTLNAQLAYEWKKMNFQLFFNNITNSIGYNSYYRGGFINQTDPFNISAQINFKF